jgi:hypothetical protein
MHISSILSPGSEKRRSGDLFFGAVLPIVPAVARVTNNDRDNPLDFFHLYSRGDRYTLYNEHTSQA